MPETSKKQTMRELIESNPDTVSRMALIDFDIGMFKDPEDAFMHFNVSEGVYMRYEEARIKALAKVISERTGADPAQIIDPKTRTPEQQEMIFELSGREMMNRIHAFLESNYVDAMNLIREHAEQKGDNIYAAFWDVDREETPEEQEDEKELSIPRLAALYYFALHTDVNPRDKGAFSEPDKKDELLQIFDRMDTFYRANRDFLQTDQSFATAFIEQDNPTNTKKAQEITERLSALAVVPQYYTAPIAKLVNSLTTATRNIEPEQDIIQLVVEVSKKGAKKKVFVTCLLSYEGDDLKITGRKPFLEFDRGVYNAVVSLYLAGNRLFTCDMIWRTMNGKTEQEQATPAQQAEITESLDKLRFMRAQIDCSAEFEMRRIALDGDKIYGGGYDDNLLHLRIRWLKTAKGQSYKAYEILATPILYEYSAAVNQLQTADIKLLDVKKLDKDGKPTTRSIEYTTQRVVIKGYLLRRIKGMMGKKNSLESRCIALRDYKKDGQIHDGLYTIAGCPELSQPAPDNMTDAEKTKRKNDARYIREDAELMLKYWKADGDIKGYSIYKEKGVNAGFKIEL